MVRYGWLVGVAIAALLVGCGDDNEPAVTPAGDSGDAGASDVGADAAPDVVDATTDTIDVSDGGPKPNLPAYSGAACPAVSAGLNTMESGPVTREFEVYLPADPTGRPLLFFWYGAGGSTQTYEWMQDWADHHDLTIVVPRAMPNMLLEWPIVSTNNPDREFVFFDDMVACVAEGQPVDTGRIYTSGFSAGALWSSQLVIERSDYLAAALIMSGGTGGFVHGYDTPATDIPILGMHGGDSDTYGGNLVSFKETMTDFLDGLVADEHFVVACDHGGGHTVPFGGFDWGIQFLKAHAYGTTQSSWADELPAIIPDYCDYWPL